MIVVKLTDLYFLVMMKYLKKVGLDVTVAANGIQCLSEFFSHSYDYFSLILVGIQFIVRV